MQESSGLTVEEGDPTLSVLLTYASTQGLPVLSVLLEVFSLNIPYSIGWKVESNISYGSAPNLIPSLPHYAASGQKRKEILGEN